jgi:hypothetical protein
VLGDLTQRRPAPGLAPRPRTRPPRPPVPDPSGPCGTPRQATWLGWGRPDPLPAEDQAGLPRRRQAHPACAQAIALAPGGAPLSAKAPARRCGRHSRGHPAPGSPRPVAGPITRLKMLKRQLCGRAHRDLLRRRFVLAPRQRQTQEGGRRAPAPGPAAAAEPCVLPQAWCGSPGTASRRGVGACEMAWRAVVVPAGPLGCLEASMGGQCVSWPT